MKKRLITSRISHGSHCDFEGFLHTTYQEQSISEQKWHVAFRLAYLYFTLAYSKTQGQDHPHIDCDYLANRKT